MRPGSTIRIAAIVAAATVGDGIFALPYVFYGAGWLIGLAYLVVLGVIVVAAHTVYLKTLEQVGEKERLLGLSRRYFGKSGFWIGFLAIIVGLLLTLVAYLILGSQFIRLALPGFPSGYAFFIFWLFLSIPVFLSDRYVVDLETVGIVCTALIIALIFATAWPRVLFQGIPAADMKNFFLPFGAILFSLAGWTSIEPAYESRRGAKRAGEPWGALALGTGLSALLYIMFAAGILGSASMITPDTASGLLDWPFWKRELVAIMGLVAVATVYLPISREIKNSLEKDLRWNGMLARLAIVAAPPALILFGLNNFLIVVGLVGGLFLSMQYILIISVGRQALPLSRAAKTGLDIAMLAFAAAAVYQIYTFIVR